MAALVEKVEGGVGECDATEGTYQRAGCQRGVAVCRRDDAAFRWGCSGRLQWKYILFVNRVRQYIEYKIKCSYVHTAHLKFSKLKVTFNLNKEVNIT